MVARRVMTEAWSVSCSRDGAAEHGVPGTPEERVRHSVLTVSSAVFDYPILHYVGDTVPARQIVMRQNDVAALKERFLDASKRRRQPEVQNHH